ncbi:unnamed protein product [Calypogeia fissa]
MTPGLENPGRKHRVAEGRAARRHGTTRSGFGTSGTTGMAGTGRAGMAGNEYGRIQVAIGSYGYDSESVVVGQGSSKGSPLQTDKRRNETNSPSPASLFLFLAFLAFSRTK